MKKIACLVAGCAAVLAVSAFAQRAPYSPPYEDRADVRTQDIEQQIQNLDESIYAADQQRRISPSQADAYIRELREIETQLLDVRSRTFGERSNDDDRQPADRPTYGGIDSHPDQDNQRDSREPAPTPDSSENGDWSTDPS
ncbi:MAG TPA: hypothetical protein VJQ77_09820 [Novosphingobium sp.]|nr:hypothetical protein [Novosphingobium sp.]